jgi:hypothetical protein
MALLQEHFDQRIIELPVQPSDLIIGAVIFQKINSIIDEYLILDSLEIHSSLGGNVIYTIEHTDKFSELNQPTWASEAWWLDPGLKTSNTDTLPEGIVIDWSYLDMETTKDKSAKQKFCPTIINGGKHEPESQG